MLELHHNINSVCAQKVRIALKEKGQEAKEHLLTLQGDQNDPAYLKLNPNGVVPTLVHDGNVIVESSLILYEPGIANWWGRVQKQEIRSSPRSSIGCRTLIGRRSRILHLILGRRCRRSCKRRDALGLSLPGLTPQVGFTRLEAFTINADPRAGRVPLQSHPFRKKMDARIKSGSSPRMTLESSGSIRAGSAVWVE